MDSFLSPSLHRVSKTLLVEARYFALGFAHFRPCFEVIALVAVRLASTNAYFGLDFAILPVQAKKREGKAFLSHLDFKLEDFFPVHQESTGSLGFMLKPFTRCFPRLYVTAVEEELPFLDSRKGVGYVDSSFSNRFDFCPFQFYAAFMASHDFVITPGFLVAGDELALRCVSAGHWRGQKATRFRRGNQAAGWMCFVKSGSYRSGVRVTT